METATEKQVKFLTHLLKTKDLSGGTPALKTLTETDVPRLPKGSAATLISFLVGAKERTMKLDNLPPSQHEHRWMSESTHKGFKGAVYQAFHCAERGCRMVKDSAYYPEYFDKGPKTVWHGPYDCGYERIKR